MKELQIAKLKHIQKEKEKLRQVRLEIATSICAKYPSLYRKLFGQAEYVMEERESVAGECLRGICDSDPVIKIILGY